MASFINLETHCHYEFVTSVGDGVPIREVLQILRLLYMGGVSWSPRIEELDASQAPVRFVRCMRLSLTPEEIVMKTTARTVLEYKQQRHDSLTYEIGLRWFLHSPLVHLFGERRGRRIGILPAQPLEVNGKTQILTIRSGPDAPVFTLRDLELDEPFLDMDFLMAKTIESNPLNPFNP